MNPLVLLYSLVGLLASLVAAQTSDILAVIDWNNLRLTPALVSSIDVQLTQVTENSTGDASYTRRLHIYEDSTVRLPEKLNASSTYIFNVFSLHIQFQEQHLVRITTDAEGKIVAANQVWPNHVWSDVGPIVPVNPIQLHALSITDLTRPRPSFNVKQILTNPTMLLSIGAVFMIFVMPYIQQNMDPELVKQMQEGGLSGLMNADPNREDLAQKINKIDMASEIAKKVSKKKK